jgi:Domain of unknown function (DUF4326)
MPSNTAPKRIQRKRTKGWKMPPNTVYVGRPTKWGNPWRKGDAVDIYRSWIAARDMDLARSGRRFEGFYSPDIKAELAGKNLACWCPLDQPCHADVLLEIAND